MNAPPTVPPRSGPPPARRCWSRRRSCPRARCARRRDADPPPRARDTERAMSQENVEIVRRGYEAFDRGDRAAAARLLAPDVEWHSVAAPLVGVGTIRGREAMLQFWEDLGEGIEGFRVSPEEFHRPRQRSGPVRRALPGPRPRQPRRGQHAHRQRLRDPGWMVAAVRDYSSRGEALEAAGLSE